MSARRAVVGVCLHAGVILACAGETCTNAGMCLHAGMLLSCPCIFLVILARACMVGMHIPRLHDISILLTLSFQWQRFDSSEVACGENRGCARGGTSLGLHLESAAKRFPAWMDAPRYGVCLHPGMTFACACTHMFCWCASACRGDIGDCLPV